MGTAQERPPDLSDPKKLASHYISKDWPKLKAAWKGVAAIAILTFLTGFSIAWYLVVQAKNASIEALQILVTTRQSKIEETQKENDRLTKQNLDLKAAISENAMPLKKRASILASQLTDLAKRSSTTIGNDPAFLNEYSDRFSERVWKTMRDLDEAGQHSDVLSTMISDGSLPVPSAKLQAMAQEFEKLAKRLKDEAQGLLGP